MWLIVYLWKGKGWIVGLAVILFSLAGEMVTNAVTNDSNYYQHHDYPFSIVLACSSLFTWWLCSRLGRDVKRQVEGPDGIMRYDKRHDNLLLIPLMYWTWILLGFAIVNMM